MSAKTTRVKTVNQKTQAHYLDQEGLRYPYAIACMIFLLKIPTPRLQK
jgi:hypothetical protein